MLSLTGYNITAYDDLGDDWHNYPGNRMKIIDFAHKSGIEYYTSNNNEGKFEFTKNFYNGIILNNVIEHFHDSPRKLLNELISCLKVGGVIFIDVPNAVNLRKRIDVLRGKTNYPSFHSYYWASYPWRGNNREYVKDDLIHLGKFLGLEILEISSHHYYLDQLSYFSGELFKAICKIFPGFKESLLFAGRRHADWYERTEPTELEAATAIKKQNYKHNINDTKSKNDIR